MKEPASLQQVGRTHILFKRRKFSYFAGCDYFRLSSHPEIMAAVREGLHKYGLSVSASRVTTGNHALYGELEAALARFFAAPAALVVSNGYATNSIVAQSLRGEFSHVLMDAKSHVSLRDASRLFDCPVLEFKTLNVPDLRRAVAAAGKNAKLILLTDGVFTYEGEAAPLGKYLKVIGPSGIILVDDAHSAGVLGRTGRGTPELEKISRDRIIQTATLSKAFGVYGGAILCSRELRDKMMKGSSLFAGSTPMPLPLVNAALRALDLLDKDRSFLKRLHHNVKYVKTALRASGLSIALSEVPVIAIKPKNFAKATALRRRLIGHGIFPSFIQYPGGPAGGYLRIVISSEHTKNQLDDLLKALSGVTSVK